ncbi:triacylglycerol lipase OBL1-like [Hibiscus syriacus]|uniref:triacylglycerol lipase OBL1-like n=1 Tax=Hibiscus syriacus TaxID=106335 RepID=UPI0019206B29|nr:triacylglycerol lipase OBL1-like [Hibiscus syriacus]
MQALGLQKNNGFPKDLQHPTDCRQYAYYTLRRKLREVLQVNPKARFLLTGHSSGGAIAILFAAVLVLHEYVYNNDLVPRIPYDDSIFLFKHFGTSIFLNSHYEGKVLAEEPDKNFYLWLWTFPKMMDSVREFIRSFILPYKKGPEYKETWLMTLVRIIGFALPGTSNHMSTDYVNSNRLGTLPLDQLKRD